jgi:hypothetical protein
MNANRFACACDDSSKICFLQAQPGTQPVAHLLLWTATEPQHTAVLTLKTSTATSTCKAAAGCSTPAWRGCWVSAALVARSLSLLTAPAD